MLLSIFFPQQPTPEPNLVAEEPSIEQTNQASTLQGQVQIDEIQRAIFSSNPRKAPGLDEIPFRVWQELWTVVKEWVHLIYQKSIQYAYLPRRWAEARIVVLPKPGKPDCTIPKAYRPISLLRTISKGLERVVAQRVSAYLEKNDVLPSMQFGARPRRSTDQALTLLIEAVYRAWRGRKVLSLVTFDV